MWKQPGSKLPIRIRAHLEQVLGWFSVTKQDIPFINLASDNKASAWNKAAFLATICNTSANWFIEVYTGQQAKKKYVKCQAFKRS